MDIAKYIGLFLLKNNFCYLHGLGNLELKKKPAAYDGTALQAPQFEVKLTPGGSIDDSLANFIATHEQTSISKAANELRTFSDATRADLNAGKEVIMARIGKFVLANGKPAFVTDPNLQYTPPPVPATRFTRREDVVPEVKEQVASTTPIRDEQTPIVSRGQLQWGKIIIAGGIAVALIAAIIAAVFYLKNEDKKTAPIAADTAAKVKPVTPPVVKDTMAHDTGKNMANAVAPVDNSAPANGGYRVLINTYQSLSAAQHRVNTLSKEWE